jgi:hypothetical protein
MRIPFLMDDQAICTSLHKARNVAFRIHNHEVHVQHYVNQRPERTHNAGAKGNVRDEASVHHVDLDGIDPGINGLAGLVA